MHAYDTLLDALNGLKKRGYTIDFNLAFDHINVLIRVYASLLLSLKLQSTIVLKASAIRQIPLLCMQLQQKMAA
jgi:hypothetical protein